MAPIHNDNGDGHGTPSKLRAPRVQVRNNHQSTATIITTSKTLLKQAKLENGGGAAGGGSGGLVGNSSIKTYRAGILTTSIKPQQPVLKKTATINTNTTNTINTNTNSSLKSQQLINSISKFNIDTTIVEEWRLKAELAESQNQRLNEKILSLQAENQKLEELLALKNTNHKDIEQLKSNLDKVEQEKNEICTQTESAISDLKLEFEKLEIEYKSKLEKAQKESELAKHTLESQLKQEIKESSEMIQHLQDNIQLQQTTFKEKEKNYETSLDNLKQALELKSSAFINAELQIDSQRQKINSLDQLLSESREKISELFENIKELKAQIQTGETIRRKLHNEVQELKGNIRVFCRVRPLLQTETNIATATATTITKNDKNISTNHILFDPSSKEFGCTGLTLLQPTENAMGHQTNKELVFNFDKIFNPQHTQTDVFEEVSQLVQSALDGYRVCIFAYGQTGSGKTFTMEGTRENFGIIPLAVHLIFSKSQELAEQKGWKFSFDTSYLEIYNETIRDLLVNNDTQLHEIKQVDNKPVITNLSVYEVTESDKVFELLQKATENRAVGETNCNERSSRSHSVFILNIKASNPITGESIEGILNLIDLAGSERLSQSGATGIRLKETQNINKSLSSLIDVITALSSNDAHIPYRNSKLTFLLQPSLSGLGSKMLMFVMISPHPDDLNESICSLRFATKVNSCQIGTAKRRNTNK